MFNYQLNFLIQCITYLNNFLFKGKQVAEQGSEGANIVPEGELQKGELVKEFNSKPADRMISKAIQGNGGDATKGWESKKGKLLDDSLQIGRYDTHL